MVRAELLQIPRPPSHPSSSTSPPLKQLKPHTPSNLAFCLRQQRPITLNHVEQAPACQKPLLKLVAPENENGHLRRKRIVIMGAVSVGILLLLGGLDDHQAWALGPEGPQVEEFWDNVRRYALYALTVSTGAIYAILEPILELLKNPISALLIIAIFGGSIYIVSQVLSAMVGVSDFSYQYGY